MSSPEFYALTGRQLDHLMRRHLRQVEEREFLFAQLTSYVINFSMVRPEKPVEIRELMPSQWAKRAAIRPRAKRRRRAAIAHELRCVMQHFMRS